MNRTYALIKDTKRALKLSVLIAEDILDVGEDISDEDIDTYYQGLMNFRRLVKQDAVDSIVGNE